MPRLVVTLKHADLKRLVAVAKRERRLPPEQAAVLILRGLEAEREEPVKGEPRPVAAEAHA